MQNKNCSNGFENLTLGEWDINSLGHLYFPKKNTSVDQKFCLDVVQIGSEKMEVRIFACKPG